MEKQAKLDVAAKLFPSVTSKKNSAVFRVSAVLKENIDPYYLQIAVNLIYEKFSLFFIRMRRGVFWNYFDKNYMHFTVSKDIKSPCENILTYENKGYIIKILYYKNRVSVEAFHSITDGSGILEFLKSLIYYYICIKYGTIAHQGKILLYDSIDEQCDDSFTKHFRDVEKKLIKKTSSKSAFLIKGKRYKKRGNCVINGIVSLQETKKYCKANECTITDLFIATMIIAIYNSKQKGTRNKNPIVIAVPVNLRGLFPSKTLRNFFGVVNIGYEMTDDTDFKTLLTSVKIQLKTLISQSNLLGSSAKNVHFSENIFITHIPLIFKNLMLPIGYKFASERKKTITLSNVGKIDFPDEAKPYIEHIEVMLYPTAKSPINCAICSYEDKLVVSFTKSITDVSVVREFFKVLNNITKSEIYVYSNDWGDANEKM